MPLARLETERLVLRPLALRDFDDYCAFWGNPDVVRFISGTPVSREDCWKRLLQTAGHWQLLGFGFFAIEEKASGRYAGAAGFHEMRRDLLPPIEGTLETGWGIVPALQGKGYAREAVEAAMTWAAAAFPSMDYSCIIHPGHARSLRLARHLGFAHDSDTTYRGNPVVLLRKAAARRAGCGAVAP
jgi:RimJ/RimL family protein N-acetyltransferase